MLHLWGYQVDVAKDGLDGVQHLFNQHKKYDLILLDIDMPKIDGWQVLKLIRNHAETAQVPVIIQTCHDTEDALVRGLKRGADAYLVKPITPRKLLAHIEALLRRVNTVTIAEPSLDGHSPEGSVPGLTRRENEILKLIAQGFSNQQTAEQLVISETTVKNHLAHIFRKLNVTNRTQAAYIAQRMNIF